MQIGMRLLMLTLVVMAKTKPHGDANVAAKDRANVSTCANACECRFQAHAKGMRMQKYVSMRILHFSRLMGTAPHPMQRLR